MQKDGHRTQTSESNIQVPSKGCPFSVELFPLIMIYLGLFVCHLCGGHSCALVLDNLL